MAIDEIFWFFVSLSSSDGFSKSSFLLVVLVFLLFNFTSIILTTHYLFEAQEMCDRIAIINKGNLVALDTTKKLLDRIKIKKILFKLKKFETNIILKLPNVKFFVESNDTIVVSYEKDTINFGE